MSGSNGRRPSDLAVVLADAPELVRAGLAKLIDSEPGMHVALESGTGAEVVAGMRHLRSRKRVVALVGLGMTGDHEERSLSGVKRLCSLLFYLPLLGHYHGSPRK